MRILHIVALALADAAALLALASVAIAAAVVGVTGAVWWIVVT
jgi:hypothetical protein